MPVYEVKDQKPPPTGEGVKPRRREVRPVEASAGVRPLDFLTLGSEWQRQKGKDWRPRKGSVTEQTLKAAQSIIALINENLGALKSGIHISLREGAGSCFLDVYDCTDGTVCEKVAELPIDIEDLPVLLRKLQQEAGILVDRKL